MTDLAKYSASGPMAGYLFQCRLGLLHGLELTRKNPEAVISIERFDDVAFETENLVECLVQAKHHVVPKSLSDKSEDVWKTLLIWIEGAQKGVFELIKMTYMLITTAECPPGSAMSKLREEASEKDIDEAYSLLTNVAEESKSQATKNARTAFLNMEPSEAKLLLSRVVVVDNHPNLTDVSSDISSHFNTLAPKNPDLAAQYLEGWWLSRVCLHLMGKHEQGIPVQHLILKAHEIGKILSEEALPIDDPTKLDVKDYTADDEFRNFVRQMRAIKITDGMVRSATSDYYRAYAQRSRWSRENLILEDELSNYDEKLQDSWRRKFEAEILLKGAQGEIEKIQLGRSIFLWAIQESTPLRNVVEKWITAGSYHGLADRDKVRWHPDYSGVNADAPELNDA
ncbi:hypothetical protein Q8W25_19300 [Shimia thalassica]|uniref:ABC-three component system protein n=1 Tax=Shimia thalassica TaxID=1715693 RepID=UPI00273241B1|nr:ABC-three component system protein [Shimia thalassica]MDP2496185.1 hypothetical protein [Shimia thalassica]